MVKIWKILNKPKYKNISQCLKDLKKNQIILSYWIIDIIRNKKNKIKITNTKVKLYRIKVRNLGFKKPTTLKSIYKKINKLDFRLVPIDIALRARLVYKNQKKGEWLRIATEMKSMVDSDNVPHLPKLGKALNKFFIETYWAYPEAIFHPHNEFVVCKYDF
tara:strand:+ start:772 stop:1254 length:483 start_codon:yes stop_codon:yes gene_type:complete